MGGTLVVLDAAPLHDLLGLYQRLLVLAVIFPCRIVLSLRLLRVRNGVTVMHTRGPCPRGPPAVPRP